MNIEGSRSFQNNFVQYSFRLSVLVLDLFIQLGIDLVYIAAKITGIIFSVVIIQVGILTFQFLKTKFLCCSNKAFSVFLRPTIDPRSYNTGQSNKLQGGSQDFSKGGSHCVKVRVLTRLSCRPPRRVSA